MRVEIKKAIRNAFPQYASFVTKNYRSAVFELPNPDHYIGGLVVQYYKKDILIRGYPPNSVVNIDSIEELIFTISKILNDELIFAVGYKNGNWAETTLNFSHKPLVLEEDVDYRIMSWSGKFDKEVKAE